jgi:hypothetical protein
MKTSRPLPCGEFSLQNLLIDHDDLLDSFDELDPIITDPAVDVIRRFETDREVTIELWREEQFLTRNLNDPNIREANLFEVCAFANRFTRAHIDHGDYSGFDSVAGKVMSNHYYPVVGRVWPDYGASLYLFKLKPKKPHDYFLVVTKEKIL